MRLLAMGLGVKGSGACNVQFAVCMLVAGMASKISIISIVDADNTFFSFLLKPMNIYG